MRSDWFRPDRQPMLDLDRLTGRDVDDMMGVPLWNSHERPLDPMAYRVRSLMSNHLSPRHATAIEDRFFLLKSVGEMAEDRGCTRAAVRGLIARACDNFTAAISKFGNQYVTVPSEEL